MSLSIHQNQNLKVALEIALDFPEFDDEDLQYIVKAHIPDCPYYYCFRCFVEDYCPHKEKKHVRKNQDESSLQFNREFRELQ